MYGKGHVSDFELKGWNERGKEKRSREAKSCKKAYLSAKERGCKIYPEGLEIRNNMWYIMHIRGMEQSCGKVYLLTTRSLITEQFAHSISLLFQCAGGLRRVKKRFS